jgi:polyphosphate kinase
VPYPRYFDREISWIAFNRRVLAQAQSERYPLLERLRYLAFVASNLDEFFEIRVANLMQELAAAPMHQAKELQAKVKCILEQTHTLVEDQYRCWNKDLVPSLASHGVAFRQNDTLSKEELAWVSAYYDREVHPVLTPLAIDPAHPFPQLSNKALNILIALDHPTAPTPDKKMAVIPVPRILPRLVRLESSPKAAFIFLSDIIRLFAGRLFPGYKILGAWGFRITRNSDLYIDEEDSEDLLTEIEEGLQNLQKGAAVRLEIRKGVDPDLLNNLLGALGLTGSHVFEVEGPPNLMRLMSLYDAIQRPDLKFAPFVPHLPSVFVEPETIFDAIAKQDILLHHPYDSFTPVVDFIQQAAKDPSVFAIKQTLYRTSGDSPIVKALAEASHNGKQVTALIELKARFDEANNIHWAKELEEAGVHVVYGLVGLKTHCKACLIVRREKAGLKRYVHLGTGNYNPKTAKAYTDISLFTAHPELTEEVAALFNTLTGFARAPIFHHLMVAPFNLHEGLLKLIHQETENAKKGKSAYIFAKLNSLIDEQIIDALYAASQAGVKIDLVVRGACALVPGAPHQSENIRVKSLLGRFLEHSRIYYFLNAGDESRLLLGSADWMPRNFFRRVEAVFPVMDPELKKTICEDWIPKFMQDNTIGSNDLLPSGKYQLAKQEGHIFSAQDYFLNYKGPLR